MFPWHRWSNRVFVDFWLTCVSSRKMNDWMLRIQPERKRKNHLNQSIMFRFQLLIFGGVFWWVLGFSSICDKTTMFMSYFTAPFLALWTIPNGDFQGCWCCKWSHLLYGRTSSVNPRWVIFKEKRHSERMRCNGIYNSYISIIYTVYIHPPGNEHLPGCGRGFFHLPSYLFYGDMDSFPGHVAPKSSRSSHQRSFWSKEVKSYNPQCNCKIATICLRKANRFPKASCQNQKKWPMFF